MDAKQRAEFDQVITSLSENVTGLAWSIFAAATRQGFTKVQAFELMQKLIGIYYTAIISRSV